MIYILNPQSNAAVYGTFTGVRQTYEVFNNLQKIAVRNRFGEVGKAISNGFKSLQKPVASTRLLSFTGIIYAVPTFCHGVKKIIHGSTQKRTEYAVITILALRTFANSCSSFLKGLQEFHCLEYLESVGMPAIVCKIAIAAITPLWIVGSALSVFMVIKKVHHLWTIQAFARQLEQKAANPETLEQFLQETKLKHLTSFFQVKGNLLKECKSSVELGALLKQRIQTTIKAQKVAILADVIYVIGTYLILINPAFAVGQIFKGFYALWLPSFAGYRSISQKNFSKACLSL